MTLDDRIHSNNCFANVARGKRPRTGVNQREKKPGFALNPDPIWPRLGDDFMPPLNRFKRFDAREFIQRGEEPFPEIWKRVTALKPDEGLIVVAPFLPSPLVERLAGEGFASRVERGAGSDWVVYFWREID